MSAVVIGMDPYKCCPSFDMSTAASFPVSMRNRGYRASDG